MARKTRNEKAAELIGYLNRGPAFSWLPPDDLPLTGAERRMVEAHATKQFQRWCDTWVKPLVLDLVPELRSR